MKIAHSLKKRFIYKLLANIVGLFIGLVTQAIIPRGLGPKAFGDFSFLNNFFSQVVSFFDAGTSIGFYTKISQRIREFKLISFYSYFILVVTVLVAIFVAVSQATVISAKLWPNQLSLYIYMAFFLAIIAWAAQILNQIVDAFGLTVPAEMGRVYQK